MERSQPPWSACRRGLFCVELVGLLDGNALTRRHEIMKQGSAEQLAENERRCKWSATLAALARVPVGETIEFPHIALSEANRLRSVLHTSGRTSRFRWSVSTKTGAIRVSKLGRWTGVTEH